MRAYLIRRVLQLMLVLFVGSIAVWAFVFALPGDPATALAGQDASGADLAAVRERLGLDRNVVVQYLTWLANALTGDFGTSYFTGDPILGLLLDRIPATVQLAVFAMTLALVIAVPVGVVAALRPNTLVGRVLQAYLTAGLAIPAFWLGLLLIIVLAVQLGLLPSASEFVPFFTDPVLASQHTVLPALAIAVHASSVIARFLAASLTDVMARDFIRTARAKGVPERRVVLGHALRNASLPTVTVVGIQLGEFLGGTVVIEAVFNYPGLGRLLFSGIGERDYALVQGGVLFVITVFVCLNFLVDLLYAYLDPRIRLS